MKTPMRSLPVFLILAHAFTPPGLAQAPQEKATKETADAEIAAQMREALASEDRAILEAALRKAKVHKFRNLQSPEREFTLYAEGMLQDRLEGAQKGAPALRKLERLFPRSGYLGEAQVVLGKASLDRKQYKDAETRFRRAITAEIPIETKRRAQELLMWTYVEQNTPEKGLPILESLHPLGTAPPSERGLAAMVEILTKAQRKEASEEARTDFLRLFPKSALEGRVDLAYGRLLGSIGQPTTAAQVFLNLLRNHPDAPEADEARLALATLLTEGKLDPKDVKNLPSAESLLAEVHKKEPAMDFGRRTQLVQLKLQIQQSRWKDALDTAEKLQSHKLPDTEEGIVRDLRRSALRAWTQSLLDGQQLEPLLPYLTREGIGDLTPEQRLLLIRKMAHLGLPSAIKDLLHLAPAKEQQALRHAAVDALEAEIHPQASLELLPRQGGTPQERLKRAQAWMIQKEWSQARQALAAAPFGAKRIELVLDLLRRPRTGSDSVSLRLKEAESWLALSRENASDREPLAILVADLRAQLGDWKGALACYPTQPAAPQRGWVALMRATGLAQLGRPKEAQVVLAKAENEPGFKMERQTLSKILTERSASR